MPQEAKQVRAYDLKIRVIATSLEEAIDLGQATVKPKRMQAAEARLKGIEDLGKTWRGIHSEDA